MHIHTCHQALLLLCLGCAPALAQEKFPTRPITLIVPFPAGGTVDILARVLAPAISEKMGVPVIVENRPGATGAIGAAHVARAKADGHTLLMVPPPVLATNQWVYKQLPYDPERDFVPVINAVTTPSLLLVHPSVPANNLKELIALAKARPKALNFASAGSGSAQHLCGELLKMSAGIDIVHVPYKGAAPAQQDVLAGHVPLMCNPLSNVISYVRAGRLRAIALAAKTRHPQAPDIPTASESGLPDFQSTAWFGVVAPAGTPHSVISALNSEFARALRSPAIAKQLEDLGLTIVADSPQEFAAFVASESAKWRKVVEVSGARAD